MTSKDRITVLLFEATTAKEATPLIGNGVFEDSAMEEVALLDTEIGRHCKN